MRKMVVTLAHWYGQSIHMGGAKSANWGRGYEMGILSNAPQGFASAVSVINSLPQGLLAELCQDVVAFIQYKVGFINAGDYEVSISKLTEGSAQECINALTFIFRSAANEHLSVDALLTDLKASMLFKEATLVVLREIWKNEGPSLCALPKHALSVGELVSMDWKLGISMSSSGCRSLSSPHVTLQLRVAESDTQDQQHTIEMTLPQFMNFSTQLKEMAVALENAS